MSDQATSTPQSFPQDSSAWQKTFVAHKQPYRYNSYAPDPTMEYTSRFNRINPERFASKMPSPSHRQATYRKTRFECDERGKRLIKLSQLNTKSGRDLASSYQASHIEPGAPPKFSRPRPSLHRKTSYCSENNPPKPYYQADLAPVSREVPTLKCMYCARTPSDLDALPSQRVRCEPSLLSITTDSTGRHQIAVNPRPRPAVSLKRTQAVRRPSTVRVSRKPVALRAETSDGNMRDVLDDAGANRAGTARRFSFECKPEKLSMGPKTVHVPGNGEYLPVSLPPRHQPCHTGYVREPAQTFDEILWRMIYAA
ncbi:hypothetical protein HBI56_109530 [Parastagonospora nodorum]|nr:hypothetical protein HBH51_047890 [Parastagonospora nodorum]KAH4055707.1 hypothetical protein HBH49_062590 [Parastagonospora nodorum]KAH4072134.1 hypothetical protein HBH50_073020 [Parastagonospora nodorum]KAH4095018.1 hypothetical protein HBH48_061280 [Parastagonospora nodorum]KAH4268098.1 hypothetical protein HBI03_056830 [Parastagonospora nodorum]